MKNEKKHNCEIALWKFVYCLMIIALHYFVAIGYHGNFSFSGGSIGVEFFFVVSGYLLGKKALAEKSSNVGIKTYDFMKNRILKMIPMIYLILFFSMIFYIAIKNYHNYQIANFVWDFLFLRNAGLKYSTLMYVGWYTSVLVMASLLLYPLVLKYKKVFVYIIGPIIILLCGGFIAYKWGGKLSWDGEYYTKCFLRGLFEMSIGICISEYAAKLKNVNWTLFGRIVLTLIEYVGFIAILFLVNTKDFHAKYDFVSLLILSICVMIAFSEQSVVYRFFNNRFVLFLEKLSFPMFLGQGLVIDFYLHFFKDKIENVFIELGIVIIIDVLFSIVCIWFVKLFEKNKRKVKGLFVEERK